MVLLVNLAERFPFALRHAQALLKKRRLARFAAMIARPYQTNSN
jgi:hypothetical protein